MVGSLTQTSMLRFNTMDSSVQRLWLSSRYLSSTNTLGPVYTPIVKTIIGTHERDKQNEDNLTYLYEYIALLNSRLQTLVTKLSNAYTTDLDTAMGDTRIGTKPAMMGVTGATPDPGAGRTTNIYYGLWGTSGGASVGPDAVNTANTISFDNITDFVPDPVTTANVNVSTGTVSFQNQGSAGAIYLDGLWVNLTDAESTKPTHYAKTTGTYELAADVLDLSTTDKATSKAKNKFEAVLWRAMRKKENKDIIKFGLMKDIIIAASSNLATGAQAQGTLNLSFDMSTGYIKIKSDRWSAFYHS